MSWSPGRDLRERESVGPYRVENPVSDQLDAVGEEKPHERIAPDQGCISPAEGCHEDPVHGDQGRQCLRAEHGQ